MAVFCKGTGLKMEERGRSNKHHGDGLRTMRMYLIQQHCVLKEMAKTLNLFYDNKEHLIIFKKKKRKESDTNGQKLAQ